MRSTTTLGAATVALGLLLAPTGAGAMNPAHEVGIAAKKADPRLKTAKSVTGDLESLSSDLSEVSSEARVLSTMFTTHEYPCEPPDPGHVDTPMVWLADTERSASTSAAAAAEHVRDAVPDLKAGRTAAANKDLNKARSDYTDVSDVQPMMLGSYQYTLTTQARLMQCYGNQDGALRAQRVIEMFTQIVKTMDDVKRQHIYNVLR